MEKKKQRYRIWRWWNRKCSKKKRRVKRLLKKWKEDKGEKETYMKERAKFRRMCEQREKAEKELEEIKRAKSEKEIWDYINRGRKKRTSASIKIKIEEWRKHFMELLNGSERKKIRGDREGKKKTEGEQRLRTEEIEKQMMKLKKGKATGEDNIPSEAWKYMKGETK